MKISFDDSITAACKSKRTSYIFGIDVFGWHFVLFVYYLSHTAQQLVLYLTMKISRIVNVKAL
jgi:hypothetical protein